MKKPVRTWKELKKKSVRPRRKRPRKAVSSVTPPPGAKFANTPGGPFFENLSDESCIYCCGTTKAEAFTRSMGMYCPNSETGTHAFEGDEIMDEKQRFWNLARTSLQSFRNLNQNTDLKTAQTAIDAMRAELLQEAQVIDPNRRTNPYNLPSLHQDGWNDPTSIDQILSKLVYLANKWLTDGRPPVPIV